MKINFFNQISKQLLFLTTLVGMSTLSVSPTLADNHADSMENDSQMEMPMENDSQMETPMENDGQTEMPMGNDGQMETPVGNDGQMEMPMGNDGQMETPVGNDGQTETPVGDSNTEVGNIVEVASGNESFSTLVQAVKAAGLVETLSDSSASYTVFAPTDEAFSQLPEGALEYLLKPENKEVLQQVLLYHVLPNEVTSSNISGGSVETLKGGVATAVTSKGVMINNANVVTPDIEASNGVIHVIDRVLLPSNLQTSLASELGIDEANIYQQ